MILLALIYAGMVAFVLAIWAGRALPIWPRVGLVCLLPWLAFAIWQTSRAPSGWPSTAKPGGTLVGGYVREPEPGDPGEIDLWLIPAGATHPRAYAVPYTRQLHQQLVQALQASKSGQKIGIKRPGRAYSKAKFVFYKEPPAAQPAKGGE